MVSNRILVVSFIVLALLQANSSGAQWVTLGGPSYNPIGATIAHGDTILADVEWNGMYWNGLFHSYDGGLTWFQDSSAYFKQRPQSPTRQIRSFFDIGSSLYAATNLGLLVSHNFGSTWDTVPGMLGVFEGPMIVLDSQFLFGSSEGMWHYDAAGGKWMPPPYPLRSFSTDAIAAIGTTIVASVHNPDDLSSYDGIYRSIDGGRTWDSARYFSKESGSIITYGGRLFAAIDSSVYESNDSGSTWASIISSPKGEWVDGLFPIGTTIFATLSNNHVVRTQDTFKTWSYVDGGMMSQAHSYEMAPCIIPSNQRLLAATPRGVFISQDKGDSWSQANQGLPSSVGEIAYLDSQVFATNYMGIFRSKFDSTIWSDRSAGLGYDAGITSLTSSGSRLYLATASSVLESTDEGHSWINRNLSFDVRTLYTKDNLVLAGTYEKGVYRSVDSGVTWTQASGLGNLTVTAITGAGSILYAATSNGIAVSRDNGVSWTDSLFKNEYVYLIAANGSELFADANALTFSASTLSGFCRSSDGGLTWERVDTTIFEDAVASMLVVGDHIFASPVIYDSIVLGGYRAAAGHPDVYCSSDNGATWTPTKLCRTAHSLTTDGINLFAGTDSTVWRRPMSEIFSSNAVQSAPPIQRTISNSPNPFSQSTQISITSAGGFADISIVNLLGQEVAHLFSGVLEAGEHSFTWYADKNVCAAGVYECVVRMNGQIQKLPLVLMR